MTQVEKSDGGPATQIERVAVFRSVMNRIKGLHRAFSAHGIEIIVIDDAIDDSNSVDCRVFIISNDDAHIDTVLVIRLLSNLPRMPGIIVIGKSEDFLSRILALEVGADSYLAETARSLEVVAQARAIIRRTSSAFAVERELSRPAVKLSSKIRFNDWSFDAASLKLSAPSGQNVFITSSEARLLTHFIRYSGVPQTRDELHAAISSGKEKYSPRSIDVSISRLKHKFVNEQKGCKLIRSVRGKGYVFTAIVEAV